MSRKFYVTTPIFYVNDKPHIGHAYTSIAADFLARYHAARGDEVFFLTGTDEHGLKTVRSAADTGKSTEELVDEISGAFRKLKDSLNLSWNDFVRTSDKEKHWPGAEELWKRIEANGDFYWNEYEGLYCVGCEAFLTEKELDNGLCPIHKKEPELIRERNLFFKLSKYTRQIGEEINSERLKIEPETRRNEILSLIRDGLRDVSFSRPREKLEWGIPVPNHEDQTMYVWCDALSNYISAIGFGRDEKQFKKWWPADVHVIGKDILRFHTAIWPGMLLSAGLPLPKRIYIHGFINIDGQKMSKSIGNVIDPNNLVKQFGSDAVRYCLLKEIPSNEDGDFSYEKFKELYRADLSNGIGNLASRISTLGEGLGELDNYSDKELLEASKIAETNYENAIEKFKLHEALSAIWQLIHFCDSYINRKKPWENKDAKVVAGLILTLRIVARLSYPIIPSAAEKIINSIIEKDKKIKIIKIESLFPRIE
jgi:methionyl-tRNA synthetase